MKVDQAETETGEAFEPDVAEAPGCNVRSEANNLN